MALSALLTKRQALPMLMSHDQWQDERPALDDNETQIRDVDV